jgi:formylglycine-generating enzyme required for sulfatase activity
MHGNVWEWTADSYGGQFSFIFDRYRVTRGGSWYNDAANCRADLRIPTDPAKKDDYRGFRPALVPSE